MTKAEIFFWSVLSFVIGISVSSFAIIQWRVIMLIGILVLISIAGVFINREMFAVFVFLACFLAGIIRCDRAFNIKDDNVVFLANKNVSDVIGTIIKEPDVRLTYTNLTIRINETSGNLQVRTDTFPQYHYGDQLKISGEIRMPEEFDGFDWQGYLLRHDIQAVSFYPSISVLQKNSSANMTSAMIKLKQSIQEKIQQSISGIEASFLSAILLGNKNNISEFWKEIFSITGTSHVIAVSGMHVSIVSGLLFIFLSSIGLSRKQIFWGIILAILGYAAIIGFSASIVRAGIMGFLVLLALKIGRVSSAKNAFTFTAAIMLLINPLLLRYDAGFQLSFMAVAGILFLQPILEELTQNWPNPLKAKSLFIVSLSAQIFTLPLAIYHFGIMSVIAPFVNLIVVPIIPIVMILGIVPLFFFFFPNVISRILWLPYKEISGAMLSVLKYMSKIPIASFEISFSWQWMLFAYIIIIALIIFHVKHEQTTQNNL